MIEYVKFNGVTLSDQWTVVNVVRSPSSMTLKSQSVQGMAGAVLTGAVPSTLTVQFTVLVKGQYSQDRRESMLRLRSILQTDAPAPLEFSDDGGKYYLAILNSIKETKYKRTDAWTITMSVYDPYLYAVNETQESLTAANVASETRTITHAVNGTVSAWPTVTLGGVVPSSAGFATVVLDGLYSMRIPIPVDTGSTVVVHCDPSDRYVTVDGAASMITPASKWWELSPSIAVHTWQMTEGSATSAVITWRGRWQV